MKDQDKTKKQLLDELKKIKTKYKNERFKLNEYFENLTILAYKISLDGKILDCNNLVVKKLGYNNKEELIGKPLVTTIYTPSSREKAENLFLKWKKTGKTRNEELQVVTKQGELLFVLLSVDTIYNENGEPLHSLSMQVDITKQKQAEEGLRKDEEKLSSIFDSSPDAITIADSKTNIVECNQATLDLHGYSSKDELIGKSAFELIASKDHESAMKNMEKTLKHGVVKNLEFTFVKKDGSEFPAELSASSIYDASGNLAGFVAITKDITEREKAELETKKFIKTIETSREAINITSANETIIYTNRAMDELFGYQRGELIGKCPSILNAGLKPEAVTKNIIDSLVKKGYWEGEIYNKKKDGTEFISLARLSALKDEKSNIINFLSSQHDVTEQKRREEVLKESESELRELKSACEQKNIALREVMAQVELEKSKIKDDIKANVGIVINPILEKLKNVKAIKQYVNMLQHHIEGLTSSYGIMIWRKGVSLTPREMEVCNLVKGGLSSKDISKLLNLSYRTIERHRDNIRHKLGISNKNINLTTFLREL